MSNQAHTPQIAEIERQAQLEINVKESVQRLIDNAGGYDLYDLIDLLGEMDEYRATYDHLMQIIERGV